MRIPRDEQQARPNSTMGKISRISNVSAGTACIIEVTRNQLLCNAYKSSSCSTDPPDMDIYTVLVPALVCETLLRNLFSFGGPSWLRRDQTGNRGQEPKG